ncbi:MAG: hypothetical protein ABEH88_06280 [Halobacteriales archaeon]
MPDTIGSTGWQLASDSEAGEVRLEHVDSGRSYVLDDAGGLRVPESEDAGSELDAHQSGLDTQAETSTETCTVQCDEETGEAIIHGATAISVDAPVVDVSARKRVDVSSAGGVNITGEDRFEENSS